MSKPAGFIIRFDEKQRVELIREIIETEIESFTDALSIRDWSLSKISLAFLSFDTDLINYIALVEKGNRVVTSKVRVKFTEIVDLNEIPISQIEALMTNRIKSHFIKSSNGVGGKVPPATWKELVKAVKKIRPSCSSEILRLEDLQKYGDYSFKGDFSKQLLLERDALGTALDIFSNSNRLRNIVLKGWIPKEGIIKNDDNINLTANLTSDSKQNTSFLDGISKKYKTEEDVLQNDLFSWNSMAPIRSVGRSTFVYSDRKLEVIYANRNDLERTTGVDLIYYNNKLDLFLLVQYKLMKEENDVMLYRPDSQFDKEISRMNDFNKSIPEVHNLESNEEYRINYNGFFFKLVPNRGIPATSGKLINGMYIHLNYMNYLIGKNGPKGPKKGRVLNFKNANRFLSNAEFANMVYKGRIGTSKNQSAELKRIIKDYYETGNAVLVAKETQRF